MVAAEFRRALEAGLNTRDTLLRVAICPDLRSPVELTGVEIASRGRELVTGHVRAAPGGVVLLLLPHATELFLLHLGLVLEGYRPAILPWPSTRVDADKYQRNLLHQLRVLEASCLVTIPQLARNLGPGLPYPAVAYPIENVTHYDQIFSSALSALSIPERSAPQVSRPVELPPEALFVQFSGGTTGMQKAVVVTAPML